jgi:hypothetical protein
VFRHLAGEALAEVGADHLDRPLQVARNPAHQDAREREHVLGVPLLTPDATRNLPVGEAIRPLRGGSRR